MCSSCELLSNFLYFCSRNNRSVLWLLRNPVVNCSQIFCTFAVETTLTNSPRYSPTVVNCSQIFCTFAVETTADRLVVYLGSCELLSNFLYFCSRNNWNYISKMKHLVVNCSQIFCTFAVETTPLIASLSYLCCELLSNFLYFCSRNNT